MGSKRIREALIFGGFNSSSHHTKCSIFLHKSLSTSYKHWINICSGENADPEATEDSWQRIQPASNPAMLKLWCVADPVQDANSLAFAFFTEPRVGKA